MIAAPPASALQPEVDLHVDDPLRPIVRGITNLPDGASLIVTLSRKASRYMGQATVTVKHGQFATERYGQGDAPLNPGRYEINVSMSLAGFQSAEVQTVIGSNGQNMTGRFVKTSEFGGGKVFDYTTMVQLGGRPNAKLDANAKAQAAVDMRKWIVESCSSMVDLVNAGIASGSIHGPIPSTPRQARVTACIDEVSKPG